MLARFIKILRWSEEYTKIDTLYLFRGGFWATLSNISAAITAFSLAVAFAHFAPKEVYGEYKYIISIVGILSSFTLTGLGTSIIKSISDGYEGTLKEAFWKNIRWSVVFLLLAFGTSVYYFINDNARLAIAILIAGSLSPLISSTNLYNSYLIAKKDFKRSAIYFNIIGGIFPAICMFVGVTLTQNSIWLIAIFFCSNALIGAILYREIKNIYKPNDKVDSEALNYGKHLSLIGILIGVANNIDQVLVFHYLGPIDLAIYNFAIAIPNQIKGPMKSLGGLIFPKFSERSDVEIKAGMTNKFVLLLVTGTLMTIVYFFMAPYIFQIFFPKYVSSTFYSQILGLSFLTIVSIPAEIYLSAKKKLREQYISNVFTSITQIAVTFVLVFYFGLLGVVIARVFIRLFWSILNIVLYEKTLSGNDFFVYQ